MRTELYRVRQIALSLYKDATDKFCEVSCEFGVVVQKDGVLFLETHVFDDADFLKVFEYNDLGIRAEAKMLTFNGTELEIPCMFLVEMSSDENKVAFKCSGYIQLMQEAPCYVYQKERGETCQSSELLRVDFWGMDLLITPRTSTTLLVDNVPFEMQLHKKDGLTYADFPNNTDAVHNVLTLELFEVFRDSLIGYLSLINGARVQITREYYNGYQRIYSFNQIENSSRSLYACGSAKLFRPSPLLFEFDNYVRWNRVLNLNKFVSHLCTAQQVIDCEDRAFILILVFEGLSKRYLEIQNDGKNPKTIISKESFETIRKEFDKILTNQLGNSEATKQLKGSIDRLNAPNKATEKFRLILEDLNIDLTPDIKKLIKNVRSMLVHEAQLKEYKDYVLLSELIREIILRLIGSKVERHSWFDKQVFSDNHTNLSYPDFGRAKDLKADASYVIISENDPRVKLRIR